MTEKKPTYRQNKATGEWERIPEREPIIASGEALFVFSVTVALIFGASILMRLFIWN